MLTFASYDRSLPVILLSFNLCSLSLSGFQTSIILPVLEHDYLGHDSYGCMTSRNSISFPLPRPEPYTFIGQTQQASDDGVMAEGEGEFVEEPEYENSLKKPAPVECRRKPEWIYG